MRLVLVVLVLLGASSALASPAIHRAGANHHLGDDSFVSRFGRLPGAGDDEALRMRVHLEYVRALLGGAAATRPELAARRTELLGYLDDYIAKGTTPRNTYVADRSPVFIDRGGQICAVGYLIERSVGRSLAEQIAAEHRVDYLEDIAAAVPEVRAWIAGSGLTLDELASIQPAYEAARATEWHTWDLTTFPQPDGPYDKFGAGTLKKQKMEGAWQVRDEAGHTLGSGVMKHGSGTWTSFYPDGKRRAVGPYVANRAHGGWTLYHPSGNVAAEGAFRRGDRDGAWTFYDDTPERTRIASGRFRGGEVVGTWKHFDAEGKLIATTREETPIGLWPDDGPETDGGAGFELDVVAAPGEVKYRIHQGTVGYGFQRLESLALDGERLYIHHTAEEHQAIYDADGNRLERTAGGWNTADCRWSTLKQRLAHAGDLAFLHGLLYRQALRHGLVTPSFFDTEEPHRFPERPIACVAPHAVPAARGRRLDAMLADHAAEKHAQLATASDVATNLLDGMRLWRQWPHIDDQFAQLFETMPGRFHKMWVDSDPQRPND